MSEAMMTGGLWPMILGQVVSTSTETVRLAPIEVGQLLLILTVFWPLAAAAGLAFGGKMTEDAVRFAARFSGLMTLAGAVALAVLYFGEDRGGDYAFRVWMDTGLESFGIRLHLGLNGISLPLFVMAAVVGAAALFYASFTIGERVRLFVGLLLVMQTGLLGLFASVDVFYFYLFHEFALIPTFILIAMFGRQDRRAVALELTIYLTLGAMLTLAGLLVLYVQSGAESFDMISLRYAVGSLPLEKTIYGLLLLGFGILVSLFPFHSWAPRGYASAPAPVAMLHAGVLKKFGLYGLIQLAGPLLPLGAAEWAPWLMWLALGNVLIIGFVTMAQRDLKLMLGNASVMHMGYAFLGIFAASVAGLGGTVLMMFAHGLSVSLLFLLADCVERRCATVEMDDLGGLGQRAPVLMGFFVAATMASIGLPGLANFWGELTIFTSLWSSAEPWVAYAAVAGIVISAVYGLRAVGKVFFGDPTREYVGGDLRYGEKVPAMLLLGVLLVAGLWPRLVADPVDAALNDLYEGRLPTLSASNEGLEP